MKATAIIAVRLLALSALYFICFSAVSAALLQSSSKPPEPSEAGAVVAALSAVSVLNTFVFGYVILRSRWGGWKVVIAIFFVFYGVTTVMPQIETAFFLTRLPPGMLPRLFLFGAVLAAIFSPLAVLILGKRKSDPAESNTHSRLEMTASEWAVKLSLIVIVYLVIYFSFGYFIAWQNAAVRAYYGGNDPGSFLAQIRSVFSETPLLPLLQVVRAILWTVIAVPVIRMMKGQSWEAGLAVALLFAVVNSQLLLPNPLMPQEVRMVHLLETATSNFLFGWLVVLILLRWRQSAIVPASQS